MEPRITAREPFAVLGIVTRISRGSETPELFTRVWRQFESYRRRIESVAIGTHYFGIKFPTDQEDVTDYVAGMMIGDDTPIPLGLEKRRVPGGQFAVFECPVEAIGDRYQYIFTVWLRDATVDVDPAVPVFEEYPENTPEQPVSIHVPIRQRHEEAHTAGQRCAGADTPEHRDPRERGARLSGTVRPACGRALELTPTPESCRQRMERSP